MGGRRRWSGPTSRVGAQAVSVSRYLTPDGKYLVFQSSQQDRSIVWARNEKREFLYRQSVEPVFLTTGGDGDVRTRRGRLHHFGARRQRVTPDTLPGGDVGWAPDGKTLVFDAVALMERWLSAAKSVNPSGMSSELRRGSPIGLATPNTSILILGRVAASSD